jgi:hypothetical protein
MPPRAASSDSPPDALRGTQYGSAQDPVESSAPPGAHGVPESYRSARERGQATVELVALLPCLVALIAALWQAVLVGWAAWGAHAAARAAARAHAIDGDAVDAARRHLPGELERGLRVTTGERGAVRVVVRIPSPPALPSLGHIGAHGRFEPQA